MKLFDPLKNTNFLLKIKNFIAKYSTNTIKSFLLIKLYLNDRIKKSII